MTSGAWGMLSVSRQFSALQFAETASRDRVARYREQAARFRELADIEPVGRLRAELIKLAGRYELLADSMEAKSRDAS